MTMEPGAGHAPFAFDGGGGDAHDFGGFFHGESAEESEFDQFGLIGVQCLEPIQRFVEFVKGDFRDGGDADGVFNGQNLGVPAAFLRALVAGVINQDAAHELGGDAEEVGAALPINAGLIHQLHVGFVDQRRRLQRMVPAFAAHVVGGDAAQFGVHDREELIVCAGGALTGVG